MWCSKKSISFFGSYTLHFLPLVKESKLCHYNRSSRSKHLSSILSFKCTLGFLGETAAQGSWVFLMEFLYSPKASNALRATESGHRLRLQEERIFQTPNYSSLSTLFHGQKTRIQGLMKSKSSGKEN